MKKGLIFLLMLAAIIVMALAVFLSDARILMIKTEYSILIAWITSLSYPGIVLLVMKGIAIINPNVKTNTIREMLTLEKKEDAPDKSKQAAQMAKKENAAEET
ncbi:MAG: hypothetical protein PHN75_18660 [Syntrophales bacterium]|nr:hypothetical protein [Syntrophales bacterium]